jgi:hypothetical protein
MSEETPVAETAPVEESPEPALDEKYELAPIPVFDAVPTENEPRIYVLGDELIAHLSGRTRWLRRPKKPLRLALVVPHRMLAALEGQEPRDQLWMVLADRGDRRAVKALDEGDVWETRWIIRAFWAAYGERQDARLGESLRSSSS